MNFKKYLGNFIRKTNLARVADKIRFYIQYSSNYFTNKKFATQNPAAKFPPPYFLYETYEVNYKSYYEDGFQTASEIVALFQSHLNFSEAGKKILDWGCGPGRVVRHLPGILQDAHLVYGCDYNEAYINWCSKNLTNISFEKNELDPPVLFMSDYFDGIYGLSIITHLSLKSHVSWIAELKRILKPGGLLLITSQGNQFKEKLLQHELDMFNAGKLVVRDTEHEGHRVYAAFQPETFMKILLKDFTLLQFIPGGSKESIHGLQDTWLVQKTFISIA
ncbi:class I SAM-dependent methyltransferase [Ferruginibacter profundus]